jgi:membrane protein YdbS with pleckstrin-like domain
MGFGKDDSGRQSLKGEWTMDEVTFEVKREQLVQYWRVICLIVGLFIPGWLLLQVGLGKAIQHWVQSLKYRINENELFISSSFVLWGAILYRQEKSIPFGKITDMRLVQGPLLNMMNIWSLHVQTASTGQQRPEAVLYALESPQEARDKILRVIADHHPVSR